MKLLHIFIIALLIHGCAVPDFNYTPPTELVSKPELNVPQTAHIGDTLIAQSYVSKHEAIKVNRRVIIKKNYELHAGYYLKKGEDSNSETFIPFSGKNGGQIISGGLADGVRALLVYKNSGMVCVITVTSTLICETDVQFERKVINVKNEFTIEKKAILSGVLDNNLFISYTESKGDFSDDKVSKSLQFDLNTTPIIEIEGAKLKILNTQNGIVTYAVINELKQEVRKTELVN